MQKTLYSLSLEFLSLCMDTNSCHSHIIDRNYMYMKEEKKTRQTRGWMWEKGENESSSGKKNPKVNWCHFHKQNVKGGDVETVEGQSTVISYYPHTHKQPVTMERETCWCEYVFLQWGHVHLILSTARAFFSVEWVDGGERMGRGGTFPILVLVASWLSEEIIAFILHL